MVGRDPCCDSHQDTKEDDEEELCDCASWAGGGEMGMAAAAVGDTGAGRCIMVASETDVVDFLAVFASRSPLGTEDDEISVRLDCVCHEAIK